MSKININKKYRTRDGREVRIYAVDGSSDNPIHGAIKNGSEWIVCTRRIDGRYTKKIDMGGDFIEVKPRHKLAVWVNCYPNGRYSMWEDKRTADILRDSSAIACIRVELDFEEGEGL